MAALSNGVTADKKNHQLEGKLTTFCKVATYLLEMYETDDVISEAESKIASFKQPAGMTAVRYSQTLW